MDITNKLIAITKRMKVSFTLKGRVISPAEIFSDIGLLPGLVKRADQLSSLCLGYGLGASFEDVEKSLLGSKVTFDDFTPDILRLFCIMDVLYELVRSSSSKSEASLDELMYD
jgi:intracellular multiplication protein IcmS